jgi:uncharacterized membrane protein YgaE (UPF0421/DUF939 family)
MYRIRETLEQSVNVQLSMYLVASIVGALFACAMVSLLYTNLFLYHPSLWLVIAIVSALYPRITPAAVLIIASGPLALLVSSLVVFLSTMFVMRRVMDWARRMLGW